MYGRPSGWGVMVVAEACEGKERGRSGLCGHGWCVWEERGGKKEGGREGEGGEEPTNSIEPQNSHKQSFFFWLGSSLSQN